MSELSLNALRAHITTSPNIKQTKLYLVDYIFKKAKVSKRKHYINIEKPPSSIFSHESFRY